MKIHTSTDVLKLASNIQAKIDKFTQLLSKIDDSKNKQSESYPSVLSASKGGREKGREGGREEGRQREGDGRTD